MGRFKGNKRDLMLDIYSLSYEPSVVHGNNQSAALKIIDNGQMTRPTFEYVTLETKLELSSF